MAEILSPGVFIEEVSSGQNVVQSVSTSNVGAIGFTPQGPTDKATLVTSFEQFSRIFGADNKNSLAVKSIAAFYSNGGKRAFFVRVMPSDSVSADGRIQSTTYNQQIATGDGVSTTFAQTNPTNSPIKDNAGATPLVPGSFTARFRGRGAVVTADGAMRRDGTTYLTPNGTDFSFEGRIDPYKHMTLGTGTSAIYFRGLAPGLGGLVTVEIVVDAGTVPRTIVTTGNSIVINVATNLGVVEPTETANSIATSVNADPTASLLVFAVGQGVGVVVAGGPTQLAGVAALDPELDLVVSGSGEDVTVLWSGATKTLVFPGTATGPIVTATSADGSGSFDRRTGIFSILSTTVPTTALVTVTVSHIAADTSTVTSGTAVDLTGKTLLSGTPLSGGGIAVNYINVADGTFSFELAAATGLHKNGRLLVRYKINAWDVKPISNGVWGNGLQVSVSGNPNFFDAVTDVYSKFDVNVLTLDSITNTYVVSETYEELDFGDPSSGVFFPDVLNDLSDLVTIVEPGGNEAPGELAGVAHTYALGGGDATTAGKAFSTTLSGPVLAKRSVVVTFTSNVDSTVKTITDDGNGAMTGDIDSAGTNTIDYLSGAVAFSTSVPIKPTTLVTVAYCSASEELTHLENLGDTAKAYTYTLTVGGLQKFYTAGTDGTFTSTTYSRNQFTDPSLIPTYKGLYALSRVDELMQVIVPDFAGDEVVSGDLLDYAETRASSPSGGDRFIILTVPKGSDPQEAVDWFRFRLKRYSKFAALYWPWVTMADGLSNGRNLTIPPLGHIAGVYARTDATKNVGKSPGGTVDGALNGITGLEYVSTLGERDFVYPNKINPLIDSAQTGLAVWGVRTISIESEWRYINARRLFMFLEKSVFNATHWIVFENNGPALWAKIKGQINGFLSNLFNEGYFAGNSPSQAFIVVCDETNNTQASIDLGQVIIDIAVAPNKPAEFVRFRFSQKSL